MVPAVTILPKNKFRAFFLTDPDADDGLPVLARLFWVVFVCLLGCLLGNGMYGLYFALPSGTEAGERALSSFGDLSLFLLDLPLVDRVARAAEKSLYLHEVVRSWTADFTKGLQEVSRGPRTLAIYVVRMNMSCTGTRNSCCQGV